MAKTISIELSVMTEDESAAVEVAEQLSRTAIALALREFNCSVNVFSFESDDDSD